MCASCNGQTEDSQQKCTTISMLFQCIILGVHSNSSSDNESSLFTASCDVRMFYFLGALGLEESWNVLNGNRC